MHIKDILITRYIHEWIYENPNHEISYNWLRQLSIIGNVTIFENIMHLRSPSR